MLWLLNTSKFISDSGSLGDSHTFSKTCNLTSSVDVRLLLTNNNQNKKRTLIMKEKHKVLRKTKRDITNNK